MTKLEKFLAVIVCLAVCVQRLSMAAGSILWGLSIAVFLYLLYKHYRQNDLNNLLENCSGYYKAFVIYYCFSQARFIKTNFFVKFTIK